VSILILFFVFLLFYTALSLLDGASIVTLALRRAETARLAAQIELRALVSIDFLFRRLAITYDVEDSFHALLQELSRVGKNSLGKAREQVLGSDAMQRLYSDPMVELDKLLR
jgi:hypothetical protein